MNTDVRRICEQLVGNLRFPALLTREDTIIYANTACLKLIPGAIPNSSISELFPETGYVERGTEMHFEVPFESGWLGISSSPLDEFILWQFTEILRTDQAYLKLQSLSRSNISMIMSGVNLLQHKCPSQEELCSTIYKSCCKLIKFSSLSTQTGDAPVFSVVNLSGLVCDFAQKYAQALSEIDVSLSCGHIAPNIPVFSDAHILDNALSGAVCLALHVSRCRGEILIELKRIRSRTVISVTPSVVAPEVDPGALRTPELMDEDYFLTINLLKNSLAKMSASLYTVCEEGSVSYLLSFPLPSENDILSASPIQPTAGIPAHLIQLSAFLPTKLYEHLS
ncbi:MAG: hypothetical protein PUA83_01470 [Clostridiales bacterium]|nr:hypothetical protein [Clostridiales bacterium]